MLHSELTAALCAAEWSDLHRGTDWLLLQHACSNFQATFQPFFIGFVADAEPETLRRRESGPIDLSRNLPMPGLSEQHVRRVLSEIANETSLPSLLDYQTDADLVHHLAAGQTWLAHCGVSSELECIVP
ncbi:hypothetical protein JMM61_20545, partial [Rhodovulum sulfidophilum]|nr:hypothetical protein [Rhodovulum sulfidophilum]